MLAVLACSFSPDDELEIWDTSSDADRSSRCFGLELKADEQMSFLKSLVSAKVDSFSGRVIILWERFLFNDSTIIRLS